MAASHLLLLLPHSFLQQPHNSLTHFNISTSFFLPKTHHLKPLKSTSSSTNPTSETSPDPPKRRGRKKSTSSTPKKPGRPKKTQTQTIELNQEDETAEFDQESDNLDEDDDFSIFENDVPLVCCFGAAQKEFVPTVRVSDEQMHPDIYADWKMLQWDPPEFVRAPGGPPSNVAISLVRLGGRAAFIGKVGDDDFGQELVLMMNKEHVQTRGVKFDEKAKTGCAYMKLKFGDDGKMRAETVKDSAEDSLLSSELNLHVLKEAKMFHFNSEVLISPSMHASLFKAILLSKKSGSLIFFDLNLPLPLWKSRDETKKVIKKAWEHADVIEITKQELEFLLDEDHYVRRRNYRPQYYADDYEQTKNRRDYYHYTREEVSPLWHPGLKFLFVTDGTLRIHYYSPTFDGVVVGTEDVLITPFTCDRTGSGDAVVAAIIRKLTTQPEMFQDQDVLERQIRFAIAAGIISQWTIGAVRGFPTESAVQNLKEQVYVPSMW